MAATLSALTFCLITAIGVIVDAIGPSIPLWVTITAAAILAISCALVYAWLNRTKETPMSEEDQPRPKLVVIGGRFDNNRGAGISLPAELAAHIEDARARENGEDGLQVRDPREQHPDGA